MAARAMRWPLTTPQNQKNRDGCTAGGTACGLATGVFRARRRGADDRLSVVGVFSGKIGGPDENNGLRPDVPTRYSTLFEFKHSTNSRKSLLKGIGVGSLAKFEENVDPFLRAHSGTGKCSSASASSKLS